MAKVRDVLLKYHETIPFPWSIRKIKKAGKDPVPFFLELGRELAQCEDVDSLEAQAVLTCMHDLDMGI